MPEIEDEIKKKKNRVCERRSNAIKSRSIFMGIKEFKKTGGRAWMVLTCEQIS